MTTPITSHSLLLSYEHLHFRNRTNRTHMIRHLHMRISRSTSSPLRSRCCLPQVSAQRSAPPRPSALRSPHSAAPHYATNPPAGSKRHSTIHRSCIYVRISQVLRKSFSNRTFTTGGVVIRTMLSSSYSQPSFVRTNITNIPISRSAVLDRTRACLLPICHTDRYNQCKT